MIKRHELVKEQVRYVIENGEFDTDVLSSENTIVIMTQDWCPQWQDMRKWVYELDVSADIDIYEFIYNKSDYFKEFMRIKETKWENDQIPYLRYYKNGKLYKETNYINRDRFRDIVEG